MKNNDKKHTCPYCNGTGNYYLEGDFNRLGGMVQCGMCCGDGYLTEKELDELEKTKAEFNSVIKGDLPRSGIFSKKLKGS